MCEGLGFGLGCSERERVKSFDTANFRHAVVKCLLLDRARSFLTGPSLSKEMDCLALVGVSVLEREFALIYFLFVGQGLHLTPSDFQCEARAIVPHQNVFCRSSFSFFPCYMQTAWAFLAICGYWVTVMDAYYFTRKSIWKDYLEFKTKSPSMSLTSEKCCLLSC